MRIRWENIFGLLLLIFSIYLFVKIRPFLDQWFENMDNSPYPYSYSPTTRIAVIGLICVTVVAVVKIIANRQG